MIWAYSPEGTRADMAPKRASMPERATRPIRVGLLDNRKANAGALLAELGDRLEQRLGAEIEHYTKPNASVAGRPELLDRVAAASDLVIAASSD
ncbi:MAG: hypothetical protein CL908_19500 [Deltaproteobacteria bacterium]|jgi:hypothetical protein|nr:hypothetical protein [Deltaproteobacteria bacterium]